MNERSVVVSWRNKAMVFLQQQSPFLTIQPPYLPWRARSQPPVNLQKHTHTPISLHCSSSTHSNNTLSQKRVLTQDEVPPNAHRRKQDPQWRGGFTLGIDLGMSRTGIAISKGFSIRPITVLELRGQKLELRLLQIAEDEEADEFIIGLPISSDGKETPQSNIVRSVAGRFAVRAAERGWRVYLQNEHGTSMDALEFMIDMGLKKSSRQAKIDAYAAVMVLERYFTMSGQGTELVLPKDLGLQAKIRQGPPKDMDFFPDDHDD